MYLFSGNAFSVTVVFGLLVFVTLGAGLLFLWLVWRAVKAQRRRHRRRSRREARLGHANL